MVVKAKQVVEPRDVSRVVAALRETAGEKPALVWAPYLGARTQELLEREGVSFADATGNVRISLSRPGLFIRTQGAVREPDPEPRPLVSLKGRGAGRAVRALADFVPPYGIRELATRALVSLASLARVVELLDRDAIVVRDDRGGILDVRVGDLVRRWGRDYGLSTTNRIGTFLAPRGIEAFQDGLRRYRGEWCLTGSLAASRKQDILPPRLAVAFARNPGQLAEACGLKEADGAGVNVILAEPYDPVVFERTWEGDGLRFAALSQVAADLLTSPGRGPAEGEALLTWMEGHVAEWRA